MQQGFRLAGEAADEHREPAMSTGLGGLGCSRELGCRSGHGRPCIVYGKWVWELKVQVKVSGL